MDTLDELSRMLNNDDLGPPPPLRRCMAENPVNYLNPSGSSGNPFSCSMIPNHNLSSILDALNECKDKMNRMANLSNLLSEDIRTVVRRQETIQQAQYNLIRLGHANNHALRDLHTKMTPKLTKTEPEYTKDSPTWKYPSSPPPDT